MTHSDTGFILATTMKGRPEMQEYGERSPEEFRAIWALECSIASFSMRFRGEYAFDYSHEAEIAAYLLDRVHPRILWGVGGSRRNPSPAIPSGMAL
ncbi:MAG: hypothetical protein ACTSYX_02170 [Candidatus Thorarchaeota archaeon]